MLSGNPEARMGTRPRLALDGSRTARHQSQVSKEMSQRSRPVLLPYMYTAECSISPDLQYPECNSPRESRVKRQTPVQSKISSRECHSSPPLEKPGAGKTTLRDAQRSYHEPNVRTILYPRHFNTTCTAGEPCIHTKDESSERRRYPYCEVCCGENTDSLVSLQHRREKREHREQPWTEDTPEHEDLQWKIVYELQLNIDGYKDDIVDLRWKGEQLQEKATLAAHGSLPPPRVLLISSTVPNAKFLPHTVKDDPVVLVVSYDHQSDSFEKILGAVQSKLNGYCPGCKAKSLLMYVQGGPAHLYLKKNRVTTVAKLKKAGSEDMVGFWQTLGGLMSKLDPDTTVINILGCNVMGYPKYVGIDLFEHLQELMKPSIVRFEAPLELSSHGNAVINSYFDMKKYKLWKSQRYSNLDRAMGL